MLFNKLRIMCGGEKDNFSDVYEIIKGFARTLVHIYLSHEKGISLSNIPSMRPTPTKRCIKQPHCSLPYTKQSLYATPHSSHNPLPN